MGCGCSDRLGESHGRPPQVICREAEVINGVGDGPSCELSDDGLLAAEARVIRVWHLDDSDLP